MDLERSIRTYALKRGTTVESENLTNDLHCSNLEKVREKM